ncbi:hypothetical protein ABIB25_000651 [Nakamurella sp. UYEF19]|uniref:hypothetical protein n=1 Tax=Nakamurella sp. UYEF19 TaxID=1756392 RepID=UPI00339551F1
MSEAESRELKVDINVIGPASHWCIRDEPQICAGAQSVAGELVFLHKAAGDSEVARFRSEAKRRYPSCRFQVVPRSSSELQAIHTQLQRENRYWAKVGDELGLEHLGVMTEGWTGAGLHPIEGYVAVPGVPAAFVDPLNRLFEARYGLGRVVAITYGGPV